VKSDSQRRPDPAPTGPPKGGTTASDQADGATGADNTKQARPTHEDEHEGATEHEVGDRTGPGAGYDQEPEQEKDPGGVA